MDLNILEHNILSKKYKSTEAFLADAQWMSHNAFIYFSGNNKNN